MQNDDPTGFLDLWSSAVQLRFNCWSCRTVVTVVPVEWLAASKLGGEIGWSSELWWESRGRSPRLWTSSPKNQQCHVVVSLSPFSWSLIPFNAKNLKSSCISHVDRMPTLLPTNNTNKLRNACISNKRWMVWAKQVGQMSPNYTKNWGSSLPPWDEGLLLSLERS